MLTHATDVVISVRKYLTIVLSPFAPAGQQMTITVRPGVDTEQKLPAAFFFRREQEGPGAVGVS